MKHYHITGNRIPVNRVTSKDLIDVKIKAYNAQRAFRRVMRDIPDYEFSSLRAYRIG